MDFTSITFTDVSRTFGRRRALHRVTMKVSSGEIVALLGPNGAGKSTLLALAATLIAPTSGSIHYGQDTARHSGAALRSRIGLLGHDLYLYTELSAAENLTFFARLYGLTSVDRRVDAAIDRAGVGERRDEPVGSFSRGMRQRLAIERALLHDPRLVLLDEPSTGLDDTAACALRTRLESLRAAGAIVVVATHDLEAVESVIDRAVILQAGRLTMLGQSTGSLRDRYRHASVSA
ncbi:MAG: ABC transporter ATP-binding protein [Acidobacteria bacterium]|nr:ABC transporter ATP-binding protein [Acidobacteriota bacterium]MCA1651290.1 ABC transporter ATP-binding protein [Acidobacteriota bacterium]